MTDHLMSDVISIKPKQKVPRLRNYLFLGTWQGVPLTLLTRAAVSELDSLTYMGFALDNISGS